MTVGNRRPRPEQKLGDIADATAEVGILHIEKETLVESADGLQNGSPSEHETPRQYGHVRGSGVTKILHVIAVHALFKDPLQRSDRESPQNKIDGRRQQFAKVLYGTIGIKHTGHQKASLRKIVHYCRKFAERSTWQLDIRIQNKVVRGCIRRKRAQGKIMSCAIPEVATRM